MTGMTPNLDELERRVAALEAERELMLARNMKALIDEANRPLFTGTPGHEHAPDRSQGPLRAADEDSEGRAPGNYPLDHGNDEARES